MKIQLDIPKEINKELKIYKSKNELKNLQESLIKILAEYFKLKLIKRD